MQQLDLFLHGKELNSALSKLASTSAHTFKIKSIDPIFYLQQQKKIIEDEWLMFVPVSD